MKKNEVSNIDTSVISVVCNHVYPSPSILNYFLQSPVNIHPHILHMIRPPPKPSLGPNSNHVSQL